MQIEHVKASADGLPERYRVSGGGLQAEVVPGAGMCLTSLEIDGRPQIAMPLPLAEFMGTLKTGGVPLLYPWANRLAGDTYAFDGREVDLSEVPDLKQVLDGESNGMGQPHAAWHEDELMAGDDPSLSVSRLPETGGGDAVWQNPLGAGSTVQLPIGQAMNAVETVATPVG